MGLTKRLALATTVVLGLSGSVQAAELFTPLLLVSSGNAFMSCFISNVSDRDTTARIEVIGFSGTVLNDTGEFVLAAGATNGASGFEDARCKFTVRNKTAVRAHGTVNHSGVGSASSAEAK